MDYKLNRCQFSKIYHRYPFYRPFKLHSILRLSTFVRAGLSLPLSLSLLQPELLASRTPLFSGVEGGGGSGCSEVIYEAFI